MKKIFACLFHPLVLALARRCSRCRPLVWWVGPLIAIGDGGRSIRRGSRVDHDRRARAAARVCAACGASWRRKRTNAALVDGMAQRARAAADREVADARRALHAGDRHAEERASAGEAAGALASAAAATSTSCPGTSSSARRARARRPRCSTRPALPAGREVRAGAAVAASAARATATGGSPTRRC